MNSFEFIKFTAIFSSTHCSFYISVPNERCNCLPTNSRKCTGQSEGVRRSKSSFLSQGQVVNQLTKMSAAVVLTCRRVAMFCSVVSSIIRCEFPCSVVNSLCRVHCSGVHTELTIFTHLVYLQISIFIGFLYIPFSSLQFDDPLLKMKENVKKAIQPILDGMWYPIL